MSSDHPNAVRVREAIEGMLEGRMDLSGAFAPDIHWHVTGDNPTSGTYGSLDEWRDLMRRRTELTGGTYRPQPQAWLGSDQHVFCFLRLTAERPDGRSIDTKHVAVFRMGDDGLAREFWDISSDQAAEDAFWADGA